MNTILQISFITCKNKFHSSLFSTINFLLSQNFCALHHPIHYNCNDNNVWIYSMTKFPNNTKVPSLKVSPQRAHTRTRHTQQVALFTVHQLWYNCCFCWTCCMYIHVQYMYIRVAYVVFVAQGMRKENSFCVNCAVFPRVWFLVFVQANKFLTPRSLFFLYECVYNIYFTIVSQI